jgi:hypothetical protein
MSSLKDLRLVHVLRYIISDLGWKLMSGSCHLESASNVEICVECQIFVIVIFFTIWGTFTVSQG